MPTTDYVQAAAADFARHIAGGGGWALGLEVAACVDPGADNGRPPGNRNDRSGSRKVSASEFARRANTSAPRVMRYVEAWERAAAVGVVNPAASHTPDEWNRTEYLPTGHDWSDFYDATESTGRTIRDASRRQMLEAAAEATGTGRSKVLDVASNPAAVATALEADPTFAAAVNRERAERAPSVRRATGQPIHRASSGLADTGLDGAIDRAFGANDRLGKVRDAIGDLRHHVTANPDLYIEHVATIERHAATLSAIALLPSGAPDHVPAEWAGEAS